MKIFFVDKLNKYKKIIRELDNENIELKEDCNFKMTKNDFAIIDGDLELENIDKLKNIIFLVNIYEYKRIWKYANNYKTLDIIDAKMPADYIASRINKFIKG